MFLGRIKIDGGFLVVGIENFLVCEVLLELVIKERSIFFEGRGEVFCCKYIF